VDSNKSLPFLVEYDRKRRGGVQERLNLRKRFAMVDDRSIPGRSLRRPRPRFRSRAVLWPKHARQSGDPSRKVNIMFPLINRPIIKWTIMRRTLSSHFGNMNEHDQVIFELIACGFSQSCEVPWVSRLVSGLPHCSLDRSKPSRLDSIPANRAGVRKVVGDLSRILQTA
jgi:hypothetical protein